ncbi:MAG: N-acetyltransferase [Rhodanobacteraceae bacterium]|nr:MAG: N-acetyltransferase [Rhodanobacteraceae bacterium]
MDIVTARLRLDALAPEDAAALLAYRGDPAVNRYQGWKPASLAEAARFIETQQDAVPDALGTWWQRAIRLRATGELIGDVGLHFVDQATVELGITLATAHQRRGDARETVEVMLDFVFGGLGKERVVANVDARNFMSMRLLEGLGMRRHDQHAEDVVFVLERADWLAPPAHWADRG